MRSQVIKISCHTCCHACHINVTDDWGDSFFCSLTTADGDVEADQTINLAVHGSIASTRACKLT